MTLIISGHGERQQTMMPKCMLTKYRVIILIFVPTFRRLAFSLIELSFLCRRNILASRQHQPEYAAYGVVDVDLCVNHYDTGSYAFIIFSLTHARLYRNIQAEAMREASLTAESNGIAGAADGPPCYSIRPPWQFCEAVIVDSFASLHINSHIHNFGFRRSPSASPRRHIERTPSFMPTINHLASAASSEPAIIMRVWR